VDLIGIPLQGRIVKQANRQIKKTKQLLDAEQAKGILFISSDGNSSLPYDVMFFLDRILKKKKDDGSPQYSNIEGVVYFSWSMLGHHPNIPLPVQFWMGFPRDSNDVKLREFIDHLEILWYEFQCTLTGQRIPRLVQTGSNLRDIKIS
jgi:hypothetical protein